MPAGTGNDQDGRMLKGGRKPWLTAAVILLLIAAASLLTPFYTEICEKNTYTGQKECTAHHITVSLLIYIGQVLEAHAGAITGVATAILAVITWRIVTLGKEQSGTTRAQLRAYVKMSHRAPGVMFSDDGCDVRLGVKNYGPTPAQVTNALVNFVILAAGQRLPIPPVYEVPAREAVRAFLVIGDEVYFTENSTISLDDVRTMPEGSTLCVFGYVDYIDIFGMRQRGGYARVYLPQADTNNLGFIGQDGYNYDRLRTRGEGNDWDEKS
jgi:hypothetical protein